MAYSDGILDKNVAVIPRDSEDSTLNAKCQFKKCLFRVEVYDKCASHMLHREQVHKVAEIRHRREVILEQNDF